MRCKRCKKHFLLLDKSHSFLTVFFIGVLQWLPVKQHIKHLFALCPVVEALLLPTALGLVSCRSLCFVAQLNWLSCILSNTVLCYLVLLRTSQCLQGHYENQMLNLIC